MQKYINEYLSFTGRFGRKQFIFRNILIFVLEAFGFFLTGLIDVVFPKSEAAAFLAYIVLTIAFILLFIAALANTVRRCHDLNYSTVVGLIVGLLPVAGLAALMMENYTAATVLLVVDAIPSIIMLFTKGTAGYNDYGPDPLQATEPVASQSIYNNRHAGYVKKVQKVYGIASVASPPRQPTSATSQPRQQLATTVAAPQQQSRINFNDLWELKKLLDEGVITQEEFTAAKKKILN